MHHVLVVDDDRAMREFVGVALVLEDYEVDTAANGAEALQKAREQPPSLVLLDLMMPVMDGRKFLAAARREGLCDRVPVVLMSAGHRAGAAEELRAQAFLAKPFELDDLLGLVQRLTAEPVPFSTSPCAPRGIPTRPADSDAASTPGRTG